MVQEYLLTLLTAVMLAAGKAIRDWVKANVSPRQLSYVAALAENVVVAAEKLGADTGIGGPEKYEYAETALLAAAKRAGIRLSREEANSLIHGTLAALDQALAEDVAVAA